MKVDLKRPLKFKNGDAVSIKFKRLTLGDLKAIESEGNSIFKPAGQAIFFKKCAIGVKADSAEFTTHEDDYNNHHGLGLRALCFQSYQRLIKFDLALIKGEKLDGDVLEEKRVLKLKYPILVKTKEGEQKVDVIQYQPKKCGEIEEFHDTFSDWADGNTSFIEAMVSFLGNFCSLPQVDRGGIDFVTNDDAMLIDLADAERLRGLLLTPFLEADINLFTWQEDLE